jgi:DNA-binding CsgD family transcriptional regulator
MVLFLVSSGCSQKEIAKRMRCAKSTICGIVKRERLSPTFADVAQ